MSLVQFPRGQPVEGDRVRSVVELMPAYIDLASRIANTEFVPGALRRRPEAVLAALMSGAERGLGPLESLRSVHVIDGRPSLSAEAMRALVFAAGHTIEIVETTATRATVIGRRAGSESTSPPFTWTLDRARRARLANKQNWQTYPEAMLLARASAELCRAVFPDVIAGLVRRRGARGRDRRRARHDDPAPRGVADPPRPTGAGRARTNPTRRARLPSQPAADLGGIPALTNRPGHMTANREPASRGSSDQPPIHAELARPSPTPTATPAIAGGTHWSPSSPAADPTDHRPAPPASASRSSSPCPSSSPTSEPAKHRSPTDPTAPSNSGPAAAGATPSPLTLLLSPSPRASRTPARRKPHPSWMPRRRPGGRRRRGPPCRGLPGPTHTHRGDTGCSLTPRPAVGRSSIRIVRAGDGLSEPLAIDAREFHLGDRVHVVWTARVTDVAFRPIRDVACRPPPHLTAIRAPSSTIDRGRRAARSPARRHRAARGVRTASRSTGTATDGFHDGARPVLRLRPYLRVQPELVPSIPDPRTGIREPVCADCFAGSTAA